MDRRDKVMFVVLCVCAVGWPLVAFGPIRDALTFLTMAEGSAGVGEAQAYFWPRVLFGLVVVMVEMGLLYVVYRVCIR